MIFGAVTSPVADELITMTSNVLVPVLVFYLAKYLSADYDSFFWLWALFQWSLSLLLLGAVIYFMKYRLEKSRRVI